MVDHGLIDIRACWPEPDQVGDHRDGVKTQMMVWKLVRLECETRNFLKLIKELESRWIHFRSLADEIASTGPMGKTMLSVISTFAQLERDQLA